MINIPNPDTRVMNLTLRDCMLNTNTTQFPLFDVENCKGTISIDSCSIVQHIRGGRADFAKPGDSGSRLTVRNVQGYYVDGTPFTIDN